MRDRRRLWIPCALFLGALAVRLAYLLESRGNPFFDAPVVDARTYLEQARLIAAGGLLGGDSAFWQPPMFPYFLAACLWVFGDGVFAAVRVAHALIGACSCLLLYRLSLRALPSAWAAAASATAMALWGPLIYFEGELLSVALEVFLYLLLLLLLARAREGTGLARWGAAGLVGGLAAVTRPNIMLFLLLAACALPWLRPRPAAGRYLRQLLAALVGFACVVGPVTWRNAAVGGEFVLVSANGGVNFYIGNNAAADSTVAIHPGMHWERLMAEPVEAGYESPGERSAYFMRRAFADISTDFPGWAGRLAEKAWLLLSGPEVKRNQDPYYAAGHSRLLSLLLWDEVISFPHGVVLPFALLGLAVTWRQRNPALDLLRLFLAGYGLSIVLFFVTSRYRTPLTPAWLPFAAAGAAWIASHVRARNWRPAAAGIAAVLAVGIALNLPAAPPTSEDAQLHHDLGEVMLRKERWRESLGYSRRAVELEPDYASAWHNMAVAWLALERPRQAEKASRRALELYPARAKTRLQYARSLWAQGARDSALVQLGETVRAAPGLVEARHLLGRWLLRLGRAEEAVPHLEAASRLDPGSWAAPYDLGRALHAAGRAREALKAFERSGLLAPGRPDPLNAAGAAALSSGDVDGARRHLERALAIDGSYAPARVNLGLTEIAAGNYQRGVELLEGAVEDAPDPVRVLQALAGAYAAVGEPEKARAALAAARAGKRTDR